MDAFGVVEELVVALVGIPFMADAHRDGEGEGEGVAGAEVGWTDEEPAVVLLDVFVIEIDARFEAPNLLGVAIGERDG